MNFLPRALHIRIIRRRSSSGSGPKHSIQIQILQKVARSLHAFGGQQAHDADGEMDGAEGTNRFCGDFGGFLGFAGGGYFGGEALEGGLELGAGGGCDEGEEEEVG